MDFDNKPWWTSRGVWGGLLGALAPLAGVFGYMVAPEDTAIIAAGIAGVTSSAGGILATIGRIQASKRIR